MDETDATARPDAAEPVEPTGRLDALIERLRHERLEVLPFYHDLRNQIVRPFNVHVETRYFFRRWKPTLGPILTLLIMELRDRCYYNPRTGERRDYCWPSQEELARALGVSVRTIIRTLQSPLARKFIRIQHRYRYDPALGKKVRTSSAYLVAMDDPLLPEDEDALTRLAAERLLAEETAQRNRLMTPDLPATASPRSAAPPAPDLPATLSDRSAPLQTDTLSVIGKNDNMADEEIPAGRDPAEEKKNASPPAALSDLPADELAAICQAYADANGRPPTPLERQRLAALARRFDAPARRATPPASGAQWVIQAIIAAVDSGSAYVAPRRIATICARWERARAAPPPDRPDRAPVPAAAAPAEPPPVDPFAEEPAPPAPAAAPPPFVVAGPRPILSRQLWQVVVDELLRRPENRRYRDWLGQAELIGQTADGLIVGTPTRAARDLLARLSGEIAVAAGAVLGAPVGVRVVVTRAWLDERAAGG
ncbi:MAG TPA: helix-turn-helix domain-containing protein [Acidimicrobiales bacterium]|nr:helix-turn-helix domain-containing protein [Acidimicrobiales bacterium]